MSHDATNWAIKQRGIKPAAKIVLWNLADRHNKDTRRCDPDQHLLAYDCEISRSSLNNQLNILEEIGLIKRVNRINPRTSKQENTFYILGLDFGRTLHIDNAVSKNCTRKAVSKKQPIPCPKNDDSRVQNLDTIENPVIKPVIKPVIQKACDIQSNVDFFNSIAGSVGWSQVQKLTDPRKKHLKARIDDVGGSDNWQSAIVRASQSDFLSGKNTTWQATFDWLCNQTNFTKLMEGNYDNRNGQRGSDKSTDTSIAAIVARRRVEAEERA